MLDNLRAGWVIAFNKRDEPIITDPENWKVRLRSSQVDLSFKSFHLAYDLMRDTAYVQVVSHAEITNTSRTLGRMMLTGFAGAMLRKDSFLGSALLDLSLRGADQSRIYTLSITFRDHTAVVCECSATNLPRLAEMFSSYAISKAAEARMSELIDLAACRT